MLISGFALMTLFTVPSAAVAKGATGEYLVYVGTYTGQKSKGIYAYRFNARTGSVTALGVAGETVNPSFLAIHPNQKYLYAVNEVADFAGGHTGAVSAFALDARTGKLTFLNQVSSQGADPCYVVVDSTGQNALVSNYGSGTVAVIRLEKDGRLGAASSVIQHSGSSVDRARQEGPHAHSINLSADNRFAIAADLGLDELLVYRFDAERGTLQANDPPFAKVNPGAGPRHFAFHPSGRFAYVISEMQSTVTAFAYDATRGTLRQLQTLSTLPEGFAGQNDDAEVRVHASGKFLYGSNRGHDSIALFTIDPERGTLTPAGHTSTQGKTPRNFNLDPTGTYLFAANQDTDNVVIFRVDPGTGHLTPTGQVLSVPSPVCVRFVPID
jgi:6-phosphogluconolactonase